MVPLDTPNDRAWATPVRPGGAPARPIVRRQASPRAEGAPPRPTEQVGRLKRAARLSILPAEPASEHHCVMQIFQSLQRITWLIGLRPAAR
jgi:hypothetical protein